MSTVPGYSRKYPFVVGIDDSRTKLVLVDTATGDKLDLAILKRNHPHDVIMQNKIQFSLSDEESKTPTNEEVTVHFVTQLSEGGEIRCYYNRVVMSKQDLESIKITGVHLLNGESDDLGALREANKKLRSMSAALRAENNNFRER